METLVTVQQRAGYVLVRIEGAPTLQEAMATIERVAAASAGWKDPALLFDLRGVSTLTHFTEQYSIGRAVAQHFAHIRRIASIVPSGRRTRASEKTARQAGANLMVFEDEDEALAWVTAGR